MAAYDSSGTLEERVARMRQAVGDLPPSDDATDEEIETYSLERYEGNLPYGYVPSENSGVTVGRGFDVGQRDAAEIQRMAGPYAEMLLPYAGLKGQAARQALAYQPLVLPPEALEYINGNANRQAIGRAREGVKEVWDKLSGREKSVLRNIAYHQGGIPPDVRSSFLGNEPIKRSQAIRSYGDANPDFKHRYSMEADSLVDHYAGMVDKSLAPPAPPPIPPAATQGEAYSELGGAFASLTDPSELAYQLGLADKSDRGDPDAPSIVMRFLEGQSKLEEDPVVRIQPGNILEGKLPFTFADYTPEELQQKREGKLSYLKDFPVTTLDVGLNVLTGAMGIPAKIAAKLGLEGMTTVRAAQGAARAFGTQSTKLSKLTARLEQASNAGRRPLAESLAKKVAAQTARVKALEKTATLKQLAGKEALAKIGIGSLAKMGAAELGVQSSADVLAGMVGGGVAEQVGPEHQGLGAALGLGAGILSPAIAGAGVGAIRRGYKGAIEPPPARAPAAPGMPSAFGAGPTSAEAMVAEAGARAAPPFEPGRPPMPSAFGAPTSPRPGPPGAPPPMPSAFTGGPPTARAMAAEVGAEPFAGPASPTYPSAFGAPTTPRPRSGGEPPEPPPPAFGGAPPRAPREPSFSEPGQPPMPSAFGAPEAPRGRGTQRTPPSAFTGESPTARAVAAGGPSFSEPGRPPPPSAFGAPTSPRSEPRPNLPETMEAVEEQLASTAKGFHVDPARRIQLDQIVEHSLQVDKGGLTKKALEERWAFLVRHAESDTDPVDPHMKKTVDVLRALDGPKDLLLRKNEVAYIKRALEKVKRDVAADPLPTASKEVREKLRRSMTGTVIDDAADEIRKSADENALTPEQIARIEGFDRDVDLGDALKRTPTLGEQEYWAKLREQETRVKKAGGPGGESLGRSAADARAARKRRGVKAPEAVAPRLVDDPGVPGGGAGSIETAAANLRRQYGGSTYWLRKQQGGLVPRWDLTADGTSIGVFDDFDSGLKALDDVAPKEKNPPPRTYVEKGKSHTTEQGTVVEKPGGKKAPVVAPELSKKDLPPTLYHVTTASPKKPHPSKGERLANLVATAHTDGSPAHIRLTKSQDEARVALNDWNRLIDLAREPTLGDVQATLRRAIQQDIDTGALPKDAFPNAESLGVLVEHLVTHPKVVGSLTDTGEKAVAAYRKYMEARQKLGGARATDVSANTSDLALMQGKAKLLAIPSDSIPAGHMITGGAHSENEVRIYGDLPEATSAPTKTKRPLAAAGDKVGKTGKPSRETPVLTPKEKANLGGVPEHDMRKRGEKANLFRRASDDLPADDVIPREPGGGPTRAKKAAPTSVGRDTYGDRARTTARTGEPLSEPTAHTPEGRPLDMQSVILNKHAIPWPNSVGKRVRRAIGALHNGLMQVFHPGHAIHEAAPDALLGLKGNELSRATQILREKTGEKSLGMVGYHHYIDEQLKEVTRLEKGHRDVRRGLKGAFNFTEQWTEAERIDFVANIEHRMKQMDSNGATSAEKEAIAGAMKALLSIQQTVFNKLTDSQRKVWFDNYFPRIWDLKATMRNQARMIREGIVTEDARGRWIKSDGTEVIMLEKADPQSAQAAYKQLRDSRHFVGKRMKFQEAENPFDYYTDMLNAGYVPMTTNPVEMILAKLEQMGAWSATVRAFEQFAEEGIIRKWTKREFDRYATIAQRAGKPFDYVVIDDLMTGVPLSPNAKNALATGRGPLEATEGMVFVAPRGVANIIRNYSSKGLIGQGKMGSWFEGWRNANGMLNGIQLALSPFHAITIAIEVAITNLELAANKMTAGALTALGKRSYYNMEKRRAFKAHELFGQGAKHALQATTLTSVPSLYFGRGNRMQAQWQEMIARGIKATAEGEIPLARADNLQVFEHLDADYLSLVGMLRHGANDMAHSIGKDFDPTVPLVLELAVRTGMRPMEHRPNFHKTWNRAWQNAAEVVRAQDDVFSKAAMGARAGVGEAWDQTQRALQWMSKPIFESLVPRAKLQAYTDIMQWELAKMGPDVDTSKLLKVGMLTQDTVDNRFGEFVYDNMLMHRVFRDFLFLTQRAPGWNWGTIREIGGGALDIGRLATLKAQRGIGRVGAKLGVKGAEALAAKKSVRGVEEWSRRASYNVALVAETVLFGGMYQLMTTGTWPGDELEEGWWKSPQGVQDAFWRFTFPKNGQMRGNNYERVAHPGYAKEINGWIHDLPKSLVETASHKLAPAFPLFNTFISGENHFQQLLYDPEASVPKQWAQRAIGALGEATTPFSISTAAARQERVGAKGFGAALGAGLSGDFEGAKAALDPQALAESALSLNPAPARMVGSKAENLINEYRQLRHPPAARGPREVKRLDARRGIVQAVRSGREPPMETVRTFVGLSGAEGMQKLNRLRRDLATTTPFQASFKSFLIGGIKAGEFYMVKDIVDGMTSDEFSQVQGTAMKVVVGALGRAANNDEREEIRDWWVATIEQKGRQAAAKAQAQQQAAQQAQQQQAPPPQPGGQSAASF